MGKEPGFGSELTSSWHLIAVLTNMREHTPG